MSRGIAVGGILAVAVCALLFPSAGGSAYHPAAGGLVVAGGGMPASGAAPSVGPSVPPLSLQIASTPGAICVAGSVTCPAGTGVARVTMTAAASPTQPYYPKIQFLIVIDSTFFNGDYRATDDPGFDLCDGVDNVPPCEESNGIPFFVSHAGAIASSLQSANPHSDVSFALMDDYSTFCDYGDCDGPLYHIDFGRFVPATDFAATVASTYQANVLEGGYGCADCDFWDNFLHSPTISAFYVGMTSSQILWSSSAHHVIIWMGDTAPRDPSYVQNYCVSGWDGGEIGGSCYSSGCEPSVSSGPGWSPACEGWVQSQDGNPHDSIAALTRSAPNCLHSVGGRCVIDTIDLVSTNTDPYSIGWPSNSVTGHSGGGPGGRYVIQNVDRIIAAGCDMAMATGGTWDGPSWASCPDGEQGTLSYVPHGSISSPRLDNPSLAAAFRSAGVGKVAPPPVAEGTNSPMFLSVPFGSIALANPLDATATCLRNGTPTTTCQRQPTLVPDGGSYVLGWNWSTRPDQNVMFNGDVWMAQFNVMATGPPFATVPIDACVTVECRAGGSDAQGGWYTWAHYAVPINGSVRTDSFELTSVRVEASVGEVVPTAPPPAPPPALAPPPFAIPNPVGQPIPTGLTVGSTVGSLSVNAVAAGILAAGAIRITLRNKPIAMKVGVKAGPVVSKYDEAARDGGSDLGRFE